MQNRDPRYTVYSIGERSHILSLFCMHSKGGSPVVARLLAPCDPSIHNCWVGEMVADADAAVKSAASNAFGCPASSSSSDQ